MTQIVLTGLAGTTSGAGGVALAIPEAPPLRSIQKGISVVGATGVGLELTVVAVAPSAAEEIQLTGENEITVQLTGNCVVADSFILDCETYGSKVRT